MLPFSFCGCQKITHPSGQPVQIRVRKAQFGQMLGSVEKVFPVRTSAPVGPRDDPRLFLQWQAATILAMGPVDDVGDGFDMPSVVHRQNDLTFKVGRRHQLSLPQVCHGLLFRARLRPKGDPSAGRSRSGVKRKNQPRRLFSSPVVDRPHRKRPMIARQGRNLPFRHGKSRVPNQ